MSKSKIEDESTINVPRSFIEEMRENSIECLNNALPCAGYRRWDEHIKALQNDIDACDSLLNENIHGIQAKKTMERTKHEESVEIRDRILYLFLQTDGRLYFDNLNPMLIDTLEMAIRLGDRCEQRNHTRIGSEN